jgi:hypothetical protein
MVWPLTQVVHWGYLTHFSGRCIIYIPWQLHSRVVRLELRGQSNWGETGGL